MAIRIRNVGHVTDNEIVATGERPGEFATFLTNLDIAPGGDGPEWSLPIVIGEGPSLRSVIISLAPFLNAEDYAKYEAEPVFIRRVSRPGECPIAVLFKNRFFMPDREPRGSAEELELALRVKRAVYKEEEELKSLRSYVSNIEA